MKCSADVSWVQLVANYFLFFPLLSLHTFLSLSFFFFFFLLLPRPKFGGGVASKIRESRKMFERAAEEDAAPPQHKFSAESGTLAKMRKGGGIQERSKSQKFAAAGGVSAMIRQQESRRTYGANAAPVPWSRQNTEEQANSDDHDGGDEGEEMSF